MRAIQLFIVLALTAAIACSKDGMPDNLLDEGTVTGRDARRCACCGGWFIKIKGETYRFQTLPASDIDLGDEQYPVEVTLEWGTAPEQCLGDEIVIEEIEFVVN